VVYHRDKIIIQDGLYWSPPGLVVEVISPSETKRRKEEKLADYASIGVPEAWLLSPEAQSVEIRELAEGQLTTTAILVAGDLHPTRFPGVSIPVTSLWPE
jgi:Uma2 family endonuclease